MAKHKYNALDREALAMHAAGKPGKIEITPTKPIMTQHDLSLAYSPGVAAPCLEIARDPSTAYDYTAKGNLVAVISNGTAILGLGNLGGLASKPVMEGKSALFKRFADVNAVDLELDATEVDDVINAVRYLGPTFGGINLEDIKAPDCFIIEQRLRELMDIPVFHDDQHGTAIIVAAGFINALELTGRNFKNTRLVVNGAGSAGIACIELIKAMGMPHENVTLCDTRGVIYAGREAGMNQWKSAHAIDTKDRTLAQAMKGADMFFGVSAEGAVSRKMVKEMAKKPIIFAMANPNPEISPEEIKAVRSDAIIATGRSDYPNQINNVLGFPYIFRGALDVRATTINDEMKIAAAHALAELAREDVPDEVAAAYSGRQLHYGPEYIIPVPFDPRLIVAVPSRVAEAAMKSGVAQRPIKDMDAYRTELSARLDPIAASMQQIHSQVRANPQRVVFSEGEEPAVIRAALSYRNTGYGEPVLIGRENMIKDRIKEIGLTGAEDLKIHNARLSKNNKAYTDYLYERLQRKGYLRRDCQRMVNNDRNVFAACMLARGDADAMVTGQTRSFPVCLEDVTRALDPKPNSELFGLSIMVSQGRTVFIADTAVHERPTAEQLADIAVQSAAKARELGHEPRVAFLSFASFGNPPAALAAHVRGAVALMDNRNVDFEYDGEMSADVALDPELRSVFPFNRLSGAANVLIMPGLHAASISSKILQKLGGGSMIGPLLVGMCHPVQIVRINSSVSDLVNHASLAAHAAIKPKNPKRAKKSAKKIPTRKKR